MKTNNLWKAIYNIQTNLELVADKSGDNKHNRYKYFTETDLFNVLKPMFKKEKIAVAIMANDNEKAVFENDRMVSVSFNGALVLKHLDDEDEMRMPIVLGATNTDSAKAIGSALTYGVRYWLCKLFLIPTEELDPDNTNNSKQVAEASLDPKTGIINDIISSVKTPEHKAMVVSAVGELKKSNLMAQSVETLNNLLKDLKGGK